MVEFPKVVKKRAFMPEKVDFSLYGNVFWPWRLLFFGRAAALPSCQPQSKALWCQHLGRFWMI